MLVGHQKQRKYILKMIELDSLPHAFLFSGREYLGKKQIAMEAIQIILCQNRGDKKIPCGNCISCAAFAKSMHPDLIAIGPVDGEIKIGQIRKLQEALSRKPVYGNLKIAIIEEAHLMAKLTQNAFLKTLEEPRGNTLIFLITPKPLMLLPTILSRIQEIKFFALADDKMQALIKVQNSAKLSELTKLAGGRPGLLFKFLEDPKFLQDYEKKIADFLRLDRENLNNRFKYTAQHSENTDEEMELLDIWLECGRKNLLRATREGDYQAAHKFVKLIKNIQNAALLLATTNVNKKLTLELVVMDF